MRKVFIAGVGMTQFAKHMDKSIKVLAKIALERVIADAGVKLSDVEAAWFSNSGWGFSYGQDCIRGQVALKPAGLEGIPITNVENACAGGSTGLHHAWLGVASGLYECALAIGAEKGYLEDKEKMFKGFWSGFDVENAMEHIKMLQAVSEKIKLADDPGVAGKDRSAFMDIYSAFCRWHMEKYGTTQKQVAIIASKDHFHSSMNPYAQFQKKMSVEEILAARLVSWPLTVPMCAPIGDGAAAVIVCSEDFLKRLKNARPVKILTSVLGSGTNRPLEAEAQDIAVRLSRKAYNIAGVGPEDINVAEVHDASSFGELHQTEAMGFCKFGEGGHYAESGATTLGGKMPVNTSGGLISRGHPIGASGIGQIFELVTQLRHEAGDRQVKNCRLALAENGGGNLGFEDAAMGIHILERVG
jgi:acetyl-CoA acetyltransferase